MEQGSFLASRPGNASFGVNAFSARIYSILTVLTKDMAAAKKSPHLTGSIFLNAATMLLLFANVSNRLRLTVLSAQKKGSPMEKNGGLEPLATSITNPLKFLITMACYELDLIGQMNQSNRVSDWDMDEYSEILDFKCTTDFSFARRGQTAFI